MERTRVASGDNNDSKKTMGMRVAESWSRLEGREDQACAIAERVFQELRSASAELAALANQPVPQSNSPYMQLVRQPFYVELMQAMGQCADALHNAEFHAALRLPEALKQEQTARLIVGPNGRTH